MGVCPETGVGCEVLPSLTHGISSRLLQAPYRTKLVLSMMLHRLHVARLPPAAPVDCTVLEEERSLVLHGLGACWLLQGAGWAWFLAPLERERGTSCTPANRACKQVGMVGMVEPLDYVQLEVLA